AAGSRADGPSSIAGPDRPAERSGPAPFDPGLSTPRTPAPPAPRPVTGRRSPPAPPGAIDGSRPIAPRAPRGAMTTPAGGAPADRPASRPGAPGSGGPRGRTAVSPGRKPLHRGSQSPLDPRRPHAIRSTSKVLLPRPGWSPRNTAQFGKIIDSRDANQD